MLSFFFISALAILLLGLGFYFWRSSSSESSNERALPPRPDFAGLFQDQKYPRVTNESGVENRKLTADQDALREQRRALLARAAQGERAMLIEADAIGDPQLYDEALNILVDGADSDPKLLSLVSFVMGHEGLGVNPKLVRRVLDSWRSEPGRGATSKMLHITARANDAKLLDEAIEAALEVWRDGRIPDMSAAELWSLCNGEFWTLSAEQRNSGAGFVLKRTLAKCQHELQAATNQ